MAARTDAPSPLEPLTPREQEVLTLLREGLTDAEIAGRLGISRAGASYHVSEIIGKLGVRNRYEASAWPERPPWWLRGLSPLALLFGGRASGRGLGVAATAMAVVLFLIVASGIGTLAFLLVRSDEDESGGVSVSRSAIAAIQSFEFETRIDVSSSEGDLDATYRGAADGASRVRGVLEATGPLLERLDAPKRAEIVSADNRVWIREPGASWRSPQFPAAESRTIILLNGLATPWFYLHTFLLEDLEFTFDRTEEIRDLETRHVRLDRSEIVGLVSSIFAINVPTRGEVALPDEGRADLQDNALEALPEDFTIEVWIVEDAGYPARIAIELTVDDDGEGLLVQEFPAGAHVRVEMDITDPNADVRIEPPAAAPPVETPTP